MVSSRDRGGGVETQDYMINWNVGPLGLVLRPDLGADMPPVVAQVLPGESVASLAGVGVGDMLVSVNGKKCSKMGYEKAMKTLYKHKLPIILHFRIPQFKTLAAQDQTQANAMFYAQTPSSNATMTPVSNPYYSPHPNGTPNSNANNTPNNNGFQQQQQQQQFHQQYPSQQPFPGQLLQYQQNQQQQAQYQQLQQFQQNQQNQQFQQNQQNQQLQPNYRSTSLSSGAPMSSGRGGRAFSTASTAFESKEQKLRKQFSVVWASGSLGFSFRPYAPGVNVPTVDLIGARGQGKNMDLVCVNDVLIAINGDKTKDLGVERVLKMLHVLEKPVVLRFHKSSHRIETPSTATATRLRRKSSAKKLAAVVEKERELERQYAEEEEEKEEEEENTEEEEEERERGEQRNLVRQNRYRQEEEEEEEEDEDDEQEVGDLDYEAMPSVRFALDDQIQLRSESRSAKPLAPPAPIPIPPPAPPADHSRAARVSNRSHHSHFDDGFQHQEPVASQFAKRVAASPKAAPQAPSPVRNPVATSSYKQQLQSQPQPQPVSAPIPVPVPVPVPAPAAPLAPTQPVVFMENDEQDLEDAFLEPDLEPDESQMPHVPISVAASAPVKRSTSSFTIPLEHAREIVAKSSGKPVAECQFGGKPLLQIEEGSVQARLLVTFAKACLAKQMKLARGDSEPTPKAKPASPQPPAQPLSQSQYRPRAPPSTHSSDRHSSDRHSSSRHSHSSVNGGRPVPTPKPVPIPVPPPSNVNVFAGNTLAPGKPKYLAYSFRQTQTNAAPAVQERREPSSFLVSSPPKVSKQQEPQEHSRIFHFHENVHYSDAPRTSNSVKMDSNERISQASHQKPQSPVERVTEISQTSVITKAPATVPQRVHEPHRISAGGLTMSQLRVSGKLTAEDIDVDLTDRFKDLGEATVAEEKEALPKRVTEMIALDTLLAMRVGEQSTVAAPRQSSEATPVSTSSLSHDEEEKEEEQPATTPVEPTLPEVEVLKPETEMQTAVTPSSNDVEDHSQEATEKKPIAHPVFVGVLATVDHPVVLSLCAHSHDLEKVMVGHTVDMIISKKRVVEEIQDILDSLEMELQFERHSFVGFGQLDEQEDFAPPAKCCSRCGKSGDVSELLMDRNNRELYCHNCYDVFFYQESASSVRNSSVSSMVPPEFDTPTDFDPFEYSLHDSMVNVEDEFMPWRHLNSDVSSERDSNLTLASTITSHADEVWL